MLFRSARQLASVPTQQTSDAQATEGWNLDSRGYVPHTVLMQRSARRQSLPRDVSAAISAQASLPL